MKYLISNQFNEYFDDPFEFTEVESDAAVALFNCDRSYRSEFFSVQPRRRVIALYVFIKVF
jgi:hypothetical protein